MMRTVVLILLLVVPGVIGFLVFGIFAAIDYVALQSAYASFTRVAQNLPSTSALIAAEAVQNIHRINVFAEGVWALLCAIYAAIGLHGLCVNRERKPG
jgi:hypothetical protein